MKSTQLEQATYPASSRIYPIEVWEEEGGALQPRGSSSPATGQLVSTPKLSQQKNVPKEIRMTHPKSNSIETTQTIRVPFPLSKSSEASLDRFMETFAKDESPVISEGETERTKGRLEPRDSNFQSGLDYDGYQTLEESDNNAYSSLDLERESHSKDELTIIDREEDSNTGEESAIDPQANKKV